MSYDCSFKMIIRGSRVNIECFKRYLIGERTKIVIGNGSTTINNDVYMPSNDIEYARCMIEGNVKWGISYSLIDIEQYNHANTITISLIDACRRLGLDMEVYSDEPNDRVQEHILLVNGEILEDVSVEYTEVYIEELDEFENEGELDWSFSI